MQASEGVQVTSSWGGKGGYKPWTFIPGARITEIRIGYGDCVDSIRFTYRDADNIPHHSETYGGNGGTPETVIL